jgi:hypothetical protein
MTEATTTNGEQPVAPPRKYLTRDELRATRPKLLKKWCDLPEWLVPGGGFDLAQLDGAQSGRVEAAQYLKGKFRHDAYRALWILACARDAAGNPVFTDADLPEIQAWPGPILNAVSDAAMALNERGAFAPVTGAEVKN